MDNKTGGSALHSESGITVRDYFAAAALTGLLSESGCVIAKEAAESEHIPTSRALAEWAYRIADAMMEARR